MNDKMREILDICQNADLLTTAGAAGAAGALGRIHYLAEQALTHHQAESEPAFIVSEHGNVFFNGDARDAKKYAGMGLYPAPQPAAQVPEGWRLVPIINIQNLLGLIDPEPVRLPTGKTMVFKNPDAADILAKISAEVRAMLAAPSIAEKRECKIKKPDTDKN